MSKNKKTKAILDEHWDEITAMKSAGKPVKDIANKFGVSRQVLEARFKKNIITTSIAEPSLKILILDIENAPMMSYHWGLWAQDIQKSMRVDDNRSYMMSIAMKWLSEDEVFYYETRTEDDSDLVAKAFEFVNQADIVIGHNSKAFDMKKLNAYAIMNNLQPPSTYRQIDTLIEAKKHFKFERNTLEHIAEALDCSPKLDHAKFQGFELWKECMAGNEDAWDEMKKYNKQDVITTEEVYLKMRPYIKGHPNVATIAESKSHKCASCGSTSLSKDGYSITNVSKFQRFKCDDCGSYSRGRSNLLPKAAREKLLTPVSNG